LPHLTHLPPSRLPDKHFHGLRNLHACSVIRFSMFSKA
jgi:hypothetical protein